MREAAGASALTARPPDPLRLTQIEISVSSRPGQIRLHFQTQISFQSMPGMASFTIGFRKKPFWCGQLEMPKIAYKNRSHVLTLL